MCGVHVCCIFIFFFIKSSLYHPLVDFTIGGVFGILLRKKKTTSLSLPETILNLGNHKGLNDFAQYYVFIYFLILLFICPILCILIECLWRLITGAKVDDPKHNSVLQSTILFNLSHHHTISHLGSYLKSNILSNKN